MEDKTKREKKKERKINIGFTKKAKDMRIIASFNAYNNYLGR